ncbi:unnamed protein product [Amoebophrya sp. A25]|nr:unnamed protein product [Amoebophrya sp. A25]|eukprot:GSA25T00012007001.1
MTDTVKVENSCTTGVVVPTTTGSGSQTGVPANAAVVGAPESPDVKEKCHDSPCTENTVDDSPLGQHEMLHGLREKAMREERTSGYQELQQLFPDHLFPDTLASPMNSENTSTREKVSTGVSDLEALEKQLQKALYSASAKKEKKNKEGKSTRLAVGNLNSSASALFNTANVVEEQGQSKETTSVEMEQQKVEDALRQTATSVAAASQDVEYNSNLDDTYTLGATTSFPTLVHPPTPATIEEMHEGQGSVSATSDGLSNREGGLLETSGSVVSDDCWRAYRTTSLGLAAADYERLTQIFEASQHLARTVSALPTTTPKHQTNAALSEEERADLANSNQLTTATGTSSPSPTTLEVGQQHGLNSSPGGHPLVSSSNLVSSSRSCSVSPQLDRTLSGSTSTRRPKQTLSPAGVPLEDDPESFPSLDLRSNSATPQEQLAEEADEDVEEEASGGADFSTGGRAAAGSVGLSTSDYERLNKIMLEPPFVRTASVDTPSALRERTANAIHEAINASNAARAAQNAADATGRKASPMAGGKRASPPTPPQARVPGSWPPVPLPFADSVPFPFFDPLAFSSPGAALAAAGRANLSAAPSDPFGNPYLPGAFPGAMEAWEAYWALASAGLNKQLEAASYFYGAGAGVLPDFGQMPHWPPTWPPYDPAAMQLAADAALHQGGGGMDPFKMLAGKSRQRRGSKCSLDGDRPDERARANTRMCAGGKSVAAGQAHMEGSAAAAMAPSAGEHHLTNAPGVIGCSDQNHLLNALNGPGANAGGSGMLPGDNTTTRSSSMHNVMNNTSNSILNNHATLAGAGGANAMSANLLNLHNMAKGQPSMNKGGVGVGSQSHHQNNNTSNFGNMMKNVAAGNNASTTAADLHRGSNMSASNMLSDGNNMAALGAPPGFPQKGQRGGNNRMGGGKVGFGNSNSMPVGGGAMGGNNAKQSMMGQGAGDNNHMSGHQQGAGGLGDGGMGFSQFDSGLNCGDASNAGGFGGGRSGGMDGRMNPQQNIAAAHRSMRKRPDTSGKFLCTYLLGVKLSDPFDVAKRIIGPDGHNVKYISHVVQGCKVRLRGEGFQNEEDNAPCQLNVSVPTKEGYIIAKHLVHTLLEKIFQDYYDYTGGRYRPRVHCQEHPLNDTIPAEWEREFKRGSPWFTSYEKPKFVTDMRHAKEVLAGIRFDGKKSKPNIAGSSGQADAGTVCSVHMQSASTQVSNTVAASSQGGSNGSNNNNNINNANMLVQHNNVNGGNGGLQMAHCSTGVNNNNANNQFNNIGGAATGVNDNVGAGAGGNMGNVQNVGPANGNMPCNNFGFAPMNSQNLMNNQNNQMMNCNNNNNNMQGQMNMAGKPHNMMQGQMNPATGMITLPTGGQKNGMPFPNVNQGTNVVNGGAEGCHLCGGCGNTGFNQGQKNCKGHGMGRNQMY